MQVPTQEKVLLDAADDLLEDAFLYGVNEEGVPQPFLPPVQNYNRVPVPLRALGRKGVMTTLSVLLSRLKVGPQIQQFNYESGYYPWDLGSYEIPSVYKDFLGNLVFAGVVGTPDMGGGGVLAVLEKPWRPRRTRIVTAVYNNQPVVIYIASNGDIVIPFDTHYGDWISFDGIILRQTTES